MIVTLSVLPPETMLAPPLAVQEYFATVRPHEAALPLASSTASPPAMRVGNFTAAMGSCAACTACSASTMPAPHWLPSFGQAHSPLVRIVGRTGRHAGRTGRKGTVVLAFRRAFSCAGREVVVDRAHQRRRFPRRSARKNSCLDSDSFRSCSRWRPGTVVPEIGGRVDRSQARRRSLLMQLPAGADNAHLRSETAVAHLGADIAQSRHRHHARAPLRCSCRAARRARLSRIRRCPPRSTTRTSMAVTVAQRALIRRAVGARARIRAAAETQVDDVGGIRIRRLPAGPSGLPTGQPGRPLIPAMMSES